MHGRIVPENVLGAVAVMDVEIHDRDALGAMRFLRVPRGDGRVVEEAEAHRGRDLGVMAGRAGRDESVARPAAHHLVDREDGAARGAKRGIEGPWRHKGVGVERDPAGFWRRLPDRVDINLRMNAGDRGIVGERRFVSREHLKRLALERAFNRAHPVGPLGMALAHVVFEAGGWERRSVVPLFTSWLPISVLSRLSMSRAPVAESPSLITCESGLWGEPNLVLNEARSTGPALHAL